MREVTQDFELIKLIEETCRRDLDVKQLTTFTSKHLWGLSSVDETHELSQFLFS